MKYRFEQGDYKLSFKCYRCGTVKNKTCVYIWHTMAGGKIDNICKDCAYKEQFGNKNWTIRKKEGVLENGKI